MKTTCHICQLRMESAFDACPQCGANLADPKAETVILSAASVKFKSLEEPGTSIALTLTDKRIIMVDAEKEEMKPGLSGGAIGGLVEGAIKGARNAVDGKPLKLRETDSIPLCDITSLTVESAGFIVKFKLFKISAKDDKTYMFNQGKKTATQWEEEIRKRIG